MKPREVLRAARQWVPFAAKTALYGTVSVTMGPLTRDHRASLWAMREWCKSSTRGLDIEVEVEGLERIPTTGPFVYAANHQSIVDVIVLGSVLPGDYKWAAKRSLLQVPFLGWHLRLAGHVPVDRSKSAKTAALVVQRFVQVLQGGKPLLVFPEGTRTHDGYLRDFKNGPFYAAVRASVPVVPVALEGTFDLMARGASDTGERNSRRVKIKIGEPQSPVTQGSESQRVVELRDRVRLHLSRELISIGGKVRASKPDVQPAEQRASG